MTEHPPFYERLVQSYKRANVSAINAVLNCVDWEFLFSNKSVNQDVKMY